MKSNSASPFPTRIAGIWLLAGLLISLLAGCLPSPVRVSPTLLPLHEEIWNRFIGEEG